MNIRKSSLLCTALALLVASARADAPATSVVLTPAFVSQYMFRGVRLVGRPSNRTWRLTPATSR